MASTSSSSVVSQRCKYDVFLSFRGEDTRDNFVSHLHAALRNKAIETFIDNELERGEEIAPTLLEAIEDSKAAVVIFSQNYASSKWCLDELAKIIECSETRAQMVLPVFYDVDPSCVGKQIGSFEATFAKHEEDFKDKLDKVQTWRDALTKAANLSGWDSQVIRPDHKLVDEIVNHILKELKRTSPTCLQGLVGMDSRIEQIITLLSLGLPDVRILGIWGMGGIGKTTIAEAVFYQISSQFEGRCFLANVREESEKRGMKDLLKEFLSETLQEKYLKIDTLNIGPYYSRRLHRKKVLIVLDDVNNSLQLQHLIGNCCWFGLGSRIIITSRDKQVLVNSVNDMYEVKGLSNAEALQLFSWNAFKLDHPTEEYMEQSKLVVDYAKGHPLALKVLGSSLFGKNKRKWESALNRLKKTPKEDIQNVLKFSYDDLDDEAKDIFLHIACFFKGEDRNSVTQVLDSCGLSTCIGVSILIDKSLVTSLEDKLYMHDLLQEMGMGIVQQESKEPGKRSRLWNHDDIYHVFTKNTGTKAIERIVLNMSKIREVHLNPNAFVKMSSLKLLKFYMPYNCKGSVEDCKVILSQGHISLPNKLRYLYWHGYPFNSLPTNFNPTGLVVLKLPYSNVKRPLRRNQHLDKLKEIDLSHSRCRIKTPDQLQAPNLERIILDGCSSLSKVPSSVSHLSKLTYMSLEGCQSIMSLPTMIDLESLETLFLSGCSNLEIFPEVSRNIRRLNLSRTAINEVPLSVECLSRLEDFQVRYCKKLKSLPSIIYKMSSLAWFDLSNCSNLENFPEIMEPMDNLACLYLNGTAIKELPFSIDNLKGVSLLHMENCRNLVSLPKSFSNLKSLTEFKLSDCSNLENLPSNLNLKILDIDGCNRHNSAGLSLPPWSGFSHITSLSLCSCNVSKLPDDLEHLSSVTYLDLRRNNFERIPASISQLSKLEYLNISYCRRLESLPELPPSIQYTEAHDCESLETIHGLKKLFELECDHSYPHEEEFTFNSCFKLDQNEWSNTIANTLLRIQCFAKIVNVHNEAVYQTPTICIRYAGGEIPESFKDHQIMGDSITIKLPPYWLNDKFLGFAFCVVVTFQDDLYVDFHVGCKCHFENNYGDSHDLYSNTLLPVGTNGLRSDHVLLWYEHKLYSTIAEKYNQLNERCYSEASFKFYPRFDQENSKVAKCGVFLLYAQDEERNELGIPMPVAVMEMKRKREREGEEQRGTTPKKLKQIKGMPESSSMDN